MKSSKYILLLGILLPLLVAGQAWGTTRYVNGQAGGQSIGLYATLQAALDDAVPGDVIYIYDHAHTPPVPGAQPGLVSYSGAAVVYDNNLLIEGVGMPVFNDGTNTLDAITVSGRTDLTIAHLTINDYKNAFYGLNAYDLDISDVTMDGNTNGMKLNVHNSTFTDLTINNSADYGYWLFTTGGYTTADGNAFTGNSLENNEVGIVVGGGDGNTFSGCTLMGNSEGFRIGACSNLDVNGNTIQNSNNEGIRIVGYAKGDIYDNSIEKNDIGIDIEFTYAGALRDLEIYNNCLGYNTTYPARDVNDFAAPWDVVWYSGGNVGNYYPDYNGAAPYTIAGAGGNLDYYPLTATNNPTGPSQVALGDPMVVDFVYTMPAVCAPFQNLKTCHFVVSWDPNLLSIVDPDDDVVKGTYLPNCQMITNPTSGQIEIDLTALGDGNYATAYSGILASITFTAAAANVGTGSITISSTYVDKDGANIPTASAPLSYQVKDLIPPEIRQADLTSSPTLDATYSALYPLTLNWKVWDDFNLKYFHWQVRNSVGAVVIAWAVVPPSHPTGAGEKTGTSTLSVAALPSGSYFLELWLRDGAPAYNADQWLFSNGKAKAFTVDNTAPAAPAFTLEDADGCADAGLTSGRLVDVSITTAYAPTDEGKVQWAYSGDPRALINFVYDFQVTIDDFDGNHPLYLQVTDVYGNVGGWGGPVTINLDRVAPDATLFSFWTVAKTNVLVLPFGAWVAQWGGNGATQYAWSVDNVVNGQGVNLTCDDATWINIITPVPTYFPITLPNGPDGNYEVCLVVRDGHGNVSNVAARVIQLDRTAPCFASFSADPDNGMPCDDNWSFPITMTFTGDPYQVRFYVDDGTPAYTGWISVTGDPFVYSFLIPAGDRVGNGVYVIKGEVRDDLGNTCTTPGSDDIQIERITPVAGVAAFDGLVPPAYVYSADAAVDVTFPGKSADAVEAMVSENPAFTGALWQPINATVINLTGTQCIWLQVYYKVRDCGGNESAPLFGWVQYDIVAPTVDNFVINGDAAKTNNPVLNLNLTITENCGVPFYMASEYSDFQGALWLPYTGTDTYTLIDQNDGDKTIFVKVKDYAGHVSNVMDDVIYLDMTPPTGTITLVADPACGALATFTCTLNNNIIQFSGVSPDVKFIRVGNINDNNPIWAGWNGVNYIWVPFDPAVQTSMVWPWLDQGGADGPRIIKVRFKDAANNICNWINASITYDATPLVWPGGAALTVVPCDDPAKSSGYAHSIEMKWPAVAGAQCYGFNWQRTTDYPAYDVPFPNYPPTITDEFPGAHNLTGTSTVFTTVDLAGIYFISLFNRDQAGNWSSSKLTARTTNYYLGDFALMGGLRIEDFQDLAAHYFAPAAHPYAPLYDIGPTEGGSIYGIPLQDGLVGFPDLVNFTFLYDEHPLSGGSGLGYPQIDQKSILSEGLVVSAVLPQSFNAGQEFDAVVSINDATPVKCLSLTFKYDMELLEALSVKPGSAFGKNNAFLFNMVQGASIYLDGAILGAENVFEGTELAVIRFRAKNTGSFQFADPAMDLRDRSNQTLVAAFSNVASRALPSQFTVSQNYPNPFNPATTIDLSLPVACDWRCDIYNVAGQIVSVVSGHNEAGIVPIVWDGSDAGGSRVASGVYFYRITADNGRFVETRKMVLMK